MRLSIARGLHKLDPAAALKFIVATLQSLRTETGLDPKDRQIFYSVLIGKNKPWLLQLDLKSLKPPEAKTGRADARSSVRSALTRRRRWR